MVAPDEWLEIYTGYKNKLVEREMNKCTEYEVKMPLNWAEIIAKRVPSGE